MRWSDLWRWSDPVLLGFAIVQMVVAFACIGFIFSQGSDVPSQGENIAFNITWPAVILGFGSFTVWVRRKLF